MTVPRREKRPAKGEGGHGVILVRGLIGQICGDPVHALNVTGMGPRQLNTYVVGRGVRQCAGASGRCQAARNRINAAQIFNSTLIVLLLSGPTTSIILMVQK